ncbi:2,5-dichloro-2,5-cyclohexadiene-1,4-diol dehydrogenase [Maritalea myrionectae]|uniref:2,5-dichloro-2,5-cyclohexadiene-1,4-diol dehydrogenase n=1 Tax=Maritalea myrionectae TaxID=454601 RepID=A0A2R4MHS9_9HYPH|nr:SDR family oxidoreductase [Maritalea myrionectae]AVX05493.1 2,5-dichloro-2,5-cyclohexadiene-1,4-diol dehydrogenase [Maritalea myrionectae]
MSTKTILITGASSGIGAATARLAVEKGWQVGLFARSEEKLNALVEELGDKATALPGDVTDFDSVKAAMDSFVSKVGGIDAVYANAGTGLSAPGTDAGDPDEWENMVNVNILGVLWTVKAAMPHLKARKGHLLLTGSAAGRRHIAGSVYGASKWFVHGYGGNLSEEMKEFGGRCTVIAPGMVDTPFFDEPKPDKLQPEDIANAVFHALDADPRCAVNEIFLMPTQ